MIAKPMKSLELHYPMIQFLIINVTLTELHQFCDGSSTSVTVPSA